MIKEEKTSGRVLWRSNSQIWHRPPISILAPPPKNTVNDFAFKMINLDVLFFVPRGGAWKDPITLRFWVIWAGAMPVLRPGPPLKF